MAKAKAKPKTNRDRDRPEISVSVRMSTEQKALVDRALGRVRADAPRWATVYIGDFIREAALEKAERILLGTPNEHDVVESPTLKQLEAALDEARRAISVALKRAEGLSNTPKQIESVQATNVDMNEFR